MQKYQKLRSAISPLGGWPIPLLSFAVGLTLIINLWSYIDGTVMYPEFVVGPDSYGDELKSRDMRAFYGMLVVVPVIYLCLNMMARRLVQRGVLLERQLTGMISMLWIPLLPWLGMTVASSTGWPPYAWYIAMLIALVLAVAFMLRRSRVSDDNKDSHHTIAGALFFSVFSGFGLVVVVSVFLPDVVLGTSRLVPVLALLPVLVVTGLLAATLSFVPTDKSNRCFSTVLVAAQLLLPLLCFAVIPARVHYEGTTTPLFYTVPLLILIGAYIVLSFRSLLARWKTIDDESTGSVRSLVSPWSLTSIAILSAIGIAGYPGLSGDDFHFGEQILPWMQWSEFGRIPFRDFFPFHGWMHMVSGIVNEIFFSGAVSHYQNAVNLMFAVSAAVTCAVVYHLAGVRISVFVALMFLPHTFYAERLLFVPPVFLLLALPSLCRRPALWLLTWVIGAGFLAFYNTVSGASFVLASILFALWQIRMAFRSATRRQLVTTVLVLVVGLISLLAISTVRDVIIGYIAFILENRPAYEIVQGRSWTASFGHAGAQAGLFSASVVYEATRFVWLFALFVFLYLLIRRFGKDGRVSFPLLFVSIGTVVFLFFISPYSLGRIDTGSPSRPGTLSYLLFTTLLPVFLYREYPEYRNRIIAVFLICAGMLAAFIGSVDRLTWQGMMWRSTRIAHVPENVRKIQGSRALGTVYADKGHWSEFEGFHKALRTVIAEDQTYFDLSNKQSYYVYANLPVPITHGATANIDNAIKQRHVLKQLEEHPPAAVFVYPRSDYDWGVNIRSYGLYRFVMLHYEPVKVGSYVFMVNSNSPAYSRRETGINASRLLAAIFPTRDLGRLPSAWGRSWTELATQAVESHKLAVNSADAKLHDTSLKTVTIKTGDAAVAGRDADLLAIDFSNGSFGDLAEELALTWTADEGASVAAVRIALSGDKLVVPLGSFPDWLLANDIESISITMPRDVEIEACSLWQRRDIKVGVTE